MYNRFRYFPVSVCSMELGRRHVYLNTVNVVTVNYTQSACVLIATRFRSIQNTLY